MTDQERERVKRLREWRAIVAASGKIRSDPNLRAWHEDVTLLLSLVDRLEGEREAALLQGRREAHVSAVRRAAKLCRRFGAHIAAREIEELPWEDQP